MSSCTCVRCYIVLWGVGNYGVLLVSGTCNVQNMHIPRTTYIHPMAQNSKQNRTQQFISYLAMFVKLKTERPPPSWLGIPPPFLGPPKTPLSSFLGEQNPPFFSQIFLTRTASPFKYHLEILSIFLLYLNLYHTTVINYTP